MGDAAGSDGVLERLGDGLLSHDFPEGLRPKPAGEDRVFHETSLGEEEGEPGGLEAT